MSIGNESNSRVKLIYDIESNDQEVASISKDQQQENQQHEKENEAEIVIAAIDNGLAFPFKHPDEWRACKLINRKYRNV